MAFTYDMAHADPTIKATSKMRFWLGDTVENKGAMPNGANFQDDELAEILSDEGDDIMRGVAAGLEVLANSWAAHAGELSLGPESEVSSQAKAYADRAIQMRKQFGYTPIPTTGQQMRKGGFNVHPRPAGAA